MVFLNHEHLRDKAFLLLNGPACYAQIIAFSFIKLSPNSLRHGRMTDLSFIIVIKLNLIYNRVLDQWARGLLIIRGVDLHFMFVHYCKLYTPFWVIVLLVQILNFRLFLRMAKVFFLLLDRGLF
jgi:hypothetical protein